jgi:hypothetical protein
MIIHPESTKCASVIGADTDDALEVWYALKLECLRTATLAALGISGPNKNVTRLGSHYKRAVGA